ncbi:MAG: OmpA family protein [Bryobacteraceae bacterium]|jgi:chemotaxis protein MotB
MKPKYFQAEAPQRDRWMISYVDVLTILLIFFIAIAAHSFPALHATPTQKKPSQQTAAETPPPDAKDDAASKAMDQIQQKLAQQGLQVQREPRGLVISLPQAVLFASGDDQVNRQAQPMIGKIAEVLRDVPNQVNLIGHADSVPIHNQRFKNNWELSAARSLRLLELLSGNYGIPESRLAVISDGSFRPKDSNDTPDGRANNRRVELVILNESGGRSH